MKDWYFSKVNSMINKILLNIEVNKLLITSKHKRRISHICYLSAIVYINIFVNISFVNAVLAPLQDLYHVNTLLESIGSVNDMTCGASTGNLYLAKTEKISKIAAGDFTQSDIIISVSPKALTMSANESKLYVTTANTVTPYSYSAGAWSSESSTSGFCQEPQGLALASNGILYIADSGNNKIIKLQNGTSTDLITTGLNNPYGVSLDSDNTYLYVVDSSNMMIKKILLSNNTVTTIAGSDTHGFQDGYKTNAAFNIPTRLVLDTFGNIFLIDYFNSAIRKITPAGLVTTILCTSFVPTAITLNPSKGVLYITGDDLNLYTMTPNYIGTDVVVKVTNEYIFGTYPITFAGGVLDLDETITLSNHISLIRPSLINTNGYSLTLTGTCDGVSNLIIVGNGSVLFANGSAYVKTPGADSLFGHFISTYDSHCTDGISINTNGRLDITSSTSDSTPIYFIGSGTIKTNSGLDISSPICLVSNGTIDANSNDISIYKQIGGVGGMTFGTSTDSSTITLNSFAHTYTGATIIASNTTLATNFQNAIASSSSVTINNSGILDLSSNSQTINNLSGGGIIKDSGGGCAITLNSTIPNTFSGTFDSSIGNITIQGYAPLNLTGDNSSYTNGITVQRGILKIGSTSALGSGMLNFNEGILQISQDISITKEITLDGHMIIDTMGHNINLSGCTITDNNFNIAVIGGGNVTFPDYYSGTHTTDYNCITYSNGTILRNGNSSASTLNGTIYFYAAVGGTPIIQANSANIALSKPINLVTSGTIDLNNYSLTLSGNIEGPCKLDIKNSRNPSGTLYLHGLNTYTGGTTVDSGVILNIIDLANLGSGSLCLNGGTLQLGQDMVFTKDITLSSNSTIDLNGFNLIICGKITSNYTLTVINSAGAPSKNLTIKVTVTGSGNITTSTYVTIPQSDLIIPSGNYELADDRIVKLLDNDGALDLKGHSLTITETKSDLGNVMDSSVGHTGIIHVGDGTAPIYVEVDHDFSVPVHLHNGCSLHVISNVTMARIQTSFP